MIIVCDGVEYPAITHRAAPPLHMIELQTQAAKTLPGVNLGMRAIEKIGRVQAEYARAHNAWQAKVKAGEDAGDEPDEPDSTMLAIGVMVFLSIRGSGERVTLEQALLRQVDFRLEPGDEVELPDPPTPGSDAPATDETAETESIGSATT